jgi:hypothetical protein
VPSTTRPPGRARCADDHEIADPELLDRHLLHLAVEVPVRDPWGAVDQETELALCSPGRPA